MSQDLITQALESISQDTALCWQVIVQESILHIYINRETESQLDYDLLVEYIRDIVSHLDSSYQGFWLYSRLLGEVEAEWQIFIDLESDLSVKGSYSLIEDTEELITEAKETIEELK